MNRILRYEVPVDDEWHSLTGSFTTPLHVGCRDPRIVEFWAWEREDRSILPMEFRVIGTGHPFDGPGTYVGTAIAPGGHLVWHLMRRLR